LDTMSDITVLVVEDSDFMRRHVAASLTRAGFKVIEATGGEEALSIANLHKPEVIVLDIMMPGIDGFETCEKLHKAGVDSAIIMLTGKSEDRHKIHGLEVGADDYIVKPFNPNELVARIKAVLRRWRRAGESSDTLDYMGIRIEYKVSKTYKHDIELDLTPREFAILNVFMQNPCKLLSKEGLYKSVWGENHFGSRKVIDVYIKRLREKVEDDPSNPQLIRTIWGKGYLFGDCDKPDSYYKEDRENHD